ncbi:DUF4129 domain-containing protein [Streptomyces sp. SID13666]|uniref:DUF4129 domain-containing protein n=1 Tax=unclassified Streptomyces TaxID=2593676 RepID=UPI0013C0BF8A|nr:MULTISPECIES: DUF4129 domain-containing protein [unclassified Streptomyces]NEA60003.1 DUF4129 domain-containing protein [Streptomyces sp. SID13666]NEA73027.1 DUF4129 domain-containing protein [Streptomyces sp. SID13588]
MARITGRPVLLLATAAIGGLVLAAGALRAGGGRSVLDPPDGSGPLSYHGGYLLLLALACVVGGALLAARYRRAVQHIDSPDPVAERLKDAALLLLTAATAVVPVAVLLSHRSNPAGTEPRTDQSLPTETASGPPVTEAPTQPPSSTGQATAGSSFDLFHLLLVVGAVLAAVVVVVALVRWLRWYLAGKAGPGLQLIPGSPDTAESALAGAVDSGRRALHGEDARAAVIACYAAMETTLARSGIARLESDSPTDLLHRAVAGGTLTGTAAGDLTQLFREARYSSHPMDDGHLRRAGTALDTIAAQLAAVEAPEAVPAVGAATTGDRAPAGDR